MDADEGGASFNETIALVQGGFGQPLTEGLPVTSSNKNARLQTTLN